MRALASSLVIALVSAVFSPAVTGCSGGPGAPGQASLSESQKGTIYYIDDHLGSAQVVADAATGAIYEYAIYPYGLDGSPSTSTSTSASTSDSTSTFESDYSYTTKERDDEIGLVYFGKRFYSPEMGRWISPDLLFVEDPKAVSRRPLEGNLYSYLANNPTGFVDRDGEFAVSSLITVGVLTATFLLSNPNVANAPAPGDTLVPNPTVAEHAQSMAIDAAVGYMGMRLWEHAFATIRAGVGAGSAAIGARSSLGRAATLAQERSISVYHGSINNFKWIKGAGLNPFKRAYVSRDLEAAYNAISPLRYEVSQGIAADMGIIESRIPKSLFDKYLAGSEKAYEAGFGAHYGVKLNSTQIILDTAEKVEVFNKYIVK